MSNITNNYESFGRFPKIYASDIKYINWESDVLHQIKQTNGLYLARGCGKSYGDSCLIKDDNLFDLRGMNKIISFDKDNGVIKAFSGITLAEIIDFIAPYNFFLPTTPGTKFITLGGAVANDVHGKNHYFAASFGNSIISFELLRSNGQKLLCSENENQEYFAATIGGLGLTGIITWVEFRLEKVPSLMIDNESIKFYDLDGFFRINEESVLKYPFTVAWIDFSSKGKSLGRGLYNRGFWSETKTKKAPIQDKIKNFPFDYPFINKYSVSAFNYLFFHKQLVQIQKNTIDFNPFFYPLDSILNWNKAYGKEGFLQYQFVLPDKFKYDGIKSIMEIIANSGLSSFLTVLKSFGSIKSKGLLSFPKEGITLAVDFRNYGKITFDLLLRLDEEVKKYDGRLYPAKDSRMSNEMFDFSFPNWKEMLNFKDERINSAFWQRVTKEIIK